MSILLLVLMLFPQMALANGMLRAQVAVQAEIYALPDFNAPVIEHLQPGTFVLISTEKEIGVSGMGVFYKIRTPSGKSGYITDSDILASSAGPLPSPSHTGKRASGHPASFGPSMALVNYSEKINSETKQGEQIFVGARRTGSAGGLGSLRSDINLMVSPFPPTFLAGVGAYGPAKGFLVQGDISAMWPFLSNKFNFASLELGPAFTYANYSATLANGPYSANRFRPGLAVGLGYGYNLSSGVLRLDLKAFVESTTYFGPMASFQFNL